MEDRSNLLTEQRLPESMHLDRMSVAEAIALMNAQDAIALSAVQAERANVARAIDLVVNSFQSGGRLIYIGAGTSGRLGVLDASECPPTFSTDPEMVQGIIAGGPEAMFRSKEGAEDEAVTGAAAIDEKNVDAKDVVMGIATGGTTPYVRGAIERAKARKAKTIFFACVPPSSNQPSADVEIRPLVGPEVLTGSTRLKAGTATKLVLNQITTIAMVRMGKVMENLMIDLQPSNTKLRDRAIRVVSMLARVNLQDAEKSLEKSAGNVRAAVTLARVPAPFLTPSPSGRGPG